MIWHVGQRVVCIGRPRLMTPRGNDGYWRATVPEVGEVYTIREIEDEGDDDDPSFRFVEIVNTRGMTVGPDGGLRGIGECSFSHRFFRPVVTTRQSKEVETEEPVT